MLHNMQRKTVNLIGSTSSTVAPFFDRLSPERGALEELAGEALDSESDVLRALVTVGIRSVEDRRLEVGYATWAAATCDEDREWSTGSTAALAERAARDDG